MEQWQQFIFMMAALSTASQTVTEHIFKKRFRDQLGTPTVGKAEDRRQSWLHLICGTVGALLAWSTGIHPLTDLLTASGGHSLFMEPIIGPPLEYFFIGAMVSYGGGFFNDLIGVMQAFQQAQAQIKKAAAESVPATAGQLPTQLPQTDRPDDADPFDISYFGNTQTAS